MTSRVLVPMDDSEMAEQALRYALENHSDAEITVLHVIGEPSSMMGKATTLALADDLEAVAEEQSREILDRARELAEEYGVEIATETRFGQPARNILNRADAFDTVVIGSHSGTLSDRLLVGNVAQTVFRRSPVPVTVVR